jgi:hypothetical protein
MISQSRGRFGPGLRLVSPPGNAEGVGKAGRRLAPAVRCARVAQLRTAQRRIGQPRHPDLPCASGLTAYAVPEFLWPPSPCEKLTARSRLARCRLPQGLTVATTVRTTRFCRTQRAPFVTRGQVLTRFGSILRSPCPEPLRADAPASTATCPRPGRLAIRPSRRVR